MKRAIIVLVIIAAVGGAAGAYYLRRNGGEVQINTSTITRGEIIDMKTIMLLQHAALKIFV